MKNRIENGDMGIMQRAQTPSGAKWQHYSVQQTIEAPRDGWLGVWDAIKSAITNKPRFAVARDVTISFWAKGEPNFSLTQVQLEK